MRDSDSGEFKEDYLPVSAEPVDLMELLLQVLEQVAMILMIAFIV